MEKQATTRKSNIELLRILAIAGIIVLHYNHVEYGAAFTHVQMGSINSVILYLLEAVSNAGVDIFLMISGFFLYRSKGASLKKVVDLLFQVMAYRVLLYGIRVIILHEAFSAKSFIFALLPVNYFIILYCVLYLLSPYINMVLKRLSESGLGKFMILIFIIFSVWPSIFNIVQNLMGMELMGINTLGIYGDEDGYTIVNFILCYCIGAFIRENYDNNRLNTGGMKLLLALVLTWAIQFIWPYLCRLNGLGFSAYNYNNPVVIIEAALTFILFLRIDIPSSKIVNTVASGAFSVFLLNIGFIGFLNTKPFVLGNTFVLLLHILASVIGIYAICLIVHIIYTFVYDRTFGLLFNKTINTRIEIENE